VIPGPAYADYTTASRRAGLDIAPLTLSPHTGFALEPADLDASWRPLRRSSSWAVPATPPAASSRPRPSGIWPAGIRTACSWWTRPLRFRGRFVSLAGADRPENVLVLLSLTKTYAIPGLRLGFAPPPRT
jgi:histidinol-phosphate/aromatic aminotransferase/cobyric acid decarboxylase-like protein